jgi:hypothetical protein
MTLAVCKRMVLVRKVFAKRCDVSLENGSVHRYPVYDDRFKGRKTKPRKGVYFAFYGAFVSEVCLDV